MSDTSTKSETSRRTPGVSSRLLQGTVSSVAKSGLTPVLGRKFGGNASNSASKSRQTPNGPKSTFGSGRKITSKPPLSGKKFTTSSAKKLVMNSTSEEENVVPTDWDASAIVAPDQLAKPKSQIGPKEIKLRTTTAKTSKSGPLRALQSNPSIPLTVSKRLQLSSVSSNNSSFLNEEDQALYDEYLLSSLMAENVRQNCQEGKNQGKKDLLSLWTALDGIRQQVLASQVANDEMEILCKRLEQTKMNAERMQESQHLLAKLQDEAREILQALENTRHSLPIKGAKLNNIEPILSQALPKLDRMTRNTFLNKSGKAELIGLLQKVHSSLEISAQNVRENRNRMEEIRSQALQETSMKLSLIQAEQNSNEIDEMIEKMLVIPALPKLIEI